MALTALVAAAALATAGSTTLNPTDDLWIYPHAPDQVSDEYLRCWGSDQGAVGDVGEFAMSFSFSVMRFKLPKDLGTIKSAKLVLMSFHDISYSGDEAIANPIEARAASGQFDEDNWDKANSKNVAPSKDKATIYGKAGVKPPANDDPFKIEINLTGEKSRFAADVTKAMAGDRVLGIALTSTLDPEGTDGSIYKVYSRAAKNKDFRPKLIIETS